MTDKQFEEMYHQLVPEMPNLVKALKDRFDDPKRKDSLEMDDRALIGLGLACVLIMLWHQERER